MLKKLYTGVPAEFGCCIHPDCPVAVECLRHIAYPQQLASSPSLRIVNPTHCNLTDKCRHFRSAKPERYALGFIGFQMRMLPAQWARFKSLLRQKYSQNAFYVRRRGDVALSPKEQRFILTALHKVGVTEDIKFDAYQDAYNWYD